jgi:hypothetical protein
MAVPKRHKYGAKPVKEDGRTFASKAEHKRYVELKHLLKAGYIEGLICQPKFTAIVNGHKVCNIILDFQYFDRTKNRTIYEDVKGMDRPISKLKRKLLMALFPEVELMLLTAK